MQGQDSHERPKRGTHIYQQSHLAEPRRTPRSAHGPSRSQGRRQAAQEAAGASLTAVPQGGCAPGTARARLCRPWGRPRWQVPARPAAAAPRSPGLPHDVAVAAVAGAPRLAPEHVVVVPGVLALVEALGAQAHARRDPARPAPVGHEVGGPNQAAERGRVVGPHGLHEAVPGLPARQQAAAPLQRLARRLAAARARRRCQHSLQQRPQLRCRRRAALAAQLRLQPHRRLPLVPAAGAGPRHDGTPRGRYGRTGLRILDPSAALAPRPAAPPSRDSRGTGALPAARAPLPTPPLPSPDTTLLFLRPCPPAALPARRCAPRAAAARNVAARRPETSRSSRGPGSCGECGEPTWAGRRPDGSGARLLLSRVYSEAAAVRRPAAARVS